MYFDVKIIGGYAVGPYNIYYDVIDTFHYATITSNSSQAINISVGDLSIGSGVNVTVPDNSTSVIIYNLSCNTSQSYSIPATPTPTPTITPSATIILTTPSLTPTITPSKTVTITPSITPTRTVTPTITPSITPSLTPTRTVSPTPSSFPPIVMTLTSTSYNGFNISCNGGSNGDIGISSITGGSGTGYQVKFTYSGGVYQSYAGPGIYWTSLGWGTYTVYVKDSTSTEYIFTISLTQPTAQSVTLYGVVNPTCGNNNGFITITTSGGVWNKTYVLYRDVTSPYQIGGGTEYTSFTGVASGSPDRAIGGLPPGGYYVGSTDANGCVSYSSVTILPVPC